MVIRTAQTAEKVQLVQFFFQVKEKLIPVSEADFAEKHIRYNLLRKKIEEDETPVISTKKIFDCLLLSTQPPNTAGKVLVKYIEVGTDTFEEKYVEQAEFEELTRECSSEGRLRQVSEDELELAVLKRREDKQTKLKFN